MTGGNQTFAFLLLMLSSGTALRIAEMPCRRSFLRVAGATSFWPQLVRAEPTEFREIGKEAPPPTGTEEPFVTLDSGVKIKNFKQGSGSEEVREGARVAIQCTGRLLNLNGVKFFSTKDNNADGFGSQPLTFVFGNGEVIPGLEEGMKGMKKGGIRRIIVPSDLGYSKYGNLEPKPTSAIDQRALDSVVLNSRRDGTLLFDVQVERIK